MRPASRSKRGWPRWPIGCRWRPGRSTTTSRRSINCAWRRGGRSRHSSCIAIGCRAVEARWLSKRLKKIRRAAGAARDLDVLAEWMRKELNGQAGGLVAMVADERAAAQPKIMAVADKCERENRFRRKMYGLLAGVRPRGKVRKTQDVSFHNWAETRLGQAAESFFAALPNQNSDLSALHQFRIRGKQLRYTLELLAAAFGPELREQHYPVVQKLQEQLGRINDCVAADARLRRWRRKIDSPAEQEILGKLVDRQRVQLDECDRRVSRLVDAGAGRIAAAGIGRAARRRRAGRSRSGRCRTLEDSAVGQTVAARPRAVLAERHRQIDRPPPGGADSRCAES